MNTTNIEMYRGDDLIIPITFKQAGEIMDITGASMQFTMKKKPTDTEVVFTVALAILDASAGTAKLTIPKTSSVNFDIRKHYYDVQFTDSLGVVSTVLYGVIDISNDITI